MGLISKKFLNRTESKLLSTFPVDDIRKQCFWFAERAYEDGIQPEHKWTFVFDVWTTIFLRQRDYRSAHLSRLYAARDWFREWRSWLKTGKLDPLPVHPPSDVSARLWWYHFKSREDEWREKLSKHMYLSVFTIRPLFDIEDKWVTDAEINLWCNAVKITFDAFYAYEIKPEHRDDILHTPHGPIHLCSPDFSWNVISLAEIALAAERNEMFAEMMLRLRLMQESNRKKEVTNKIILEESIGVLEDIVAIRESSDMSERKKYRESLFIHMLLLQKNHLRFSSEYSLHNWLSTICRHLYEYDLVENRDEFIKYLGIYAMMGGRNLAKQFVKDDVQFVNWAEEDLPTAEEVIAHLATKYPAPVVES